MGSPIAIDYTLIAQVVSFLVICLILFKLISISNKRKSDMEVLRKLDRIIDLLENSKKN
ncbi:hypothetical protein DSOL_3765 [Desulfosporosinus metallidurans]|uniref:DUF4083 domain-containing protein n=1 Tax=Desulfosporosinus metallidurans TaxID=1888891 RepID=A0A1Q8QNQ2_9FIRM|nr:hypothetical protein DSOL_3765 [Desulfosporosinus metallidurans]